MFHPCEPHDITQLLSALRSGDREAESRLAECVYEELRAIARNRMRSERADHTLQPTVLVNEAWLRLTRSEALQISDRVHFFRLASETMRRILVDHARKSRAAKRDAARKSPLEDEVPAPAKASLDILAIDAALAELQELDARQAQVVELRFFGGLTEDEIATLQGVSAKTVRRDWRMAKDWLRTRLGSEPDADDLIVS